MIVEYIYILTHSIIAIILSLVLFLISYTYILKNIYEEKVSAYECGFNPFEDARKKFDVQFYLVAILFIIFDLEISLLFPSVIVKSSINLFGFFIIVIFLVILILGFIYEGFLGAMEG